GLAAENALQCSALRFVRALVHENRILEIAGLLPDVAAERTEHRNIQAVEIDGAVAALLDVPDENALAEPVVGRLGPRAGAGNCAAAHVEPLTREVPLLNIGHD